MLTAELGTMHGYANVTVKGHAKQRAREWRKLGRDTAPEQTGKANVEGWQQLASAFEAMGVPIQRGGDSLVTQ